MTFAEKYKQRGQDKVIAFGVLFTHRYARRSHEQQLRIGPTTLPWSDHAKFLGGTLERNVQRKARAAMAIHSLPTDQQTQQN